MLDQRRCTHHWMLGDWPPGAGPVRFTVSGTCRRCGTIRWFPATWRGEVRNTMAYTEGQLPASPQRIMGEFAKHGS